MKLSEMSEALEEQGFKEVPTSKLSTDIMEYHIGSNNIIHYPRWHRYSMDSGNLNGTSIFLDECDKYISDVELVLPDEIQNMYWDAVKKLEEVTEIPYDSRYSTNISGYASSCSKLYDILHSAFSTLLENSGITPNIESIGRLYKDLKLDLCMLNHPSNKVIFGDNYLLSLTQENKVFLKEKEFYLDFISQLPDKMQILNSQNNVWTKLVDGLCANGETNKKFYQDAGLDWRMPIEIGNAMYYYLGDIENRIPEHNSGLLTFVRHIAAQLESGNVSSENVMPAHLDGEISPEQFYHVAEGALGLMVDPVNAQVGQKETPGSHYTSNQQELHNLIPEIAGVVGGPEFGMGVQYVGLSKSRSTSQ